MTPRPPDPWGDLVKVLRFTVIYLAVWIMLVAALDIGTRG